MQGDWRKDFEYRARVVRQSRTVRREIGLDLPPEIEIRVRDITADARYMEFPVQPPEPHPAGRYRLLEGAGAIGRETRGGEF